MIFLTSEPLWISGLLLVGLPTLLGMVGPVLIRRRVPLDRLRTNNEVAGFKFATVGVLYAVLIGFAVIVVWEKFTDAESNVALEAGAAATIYRLADGIGSDSGGALRDEVSLYLKAVINQDWPAMERGSGSAAVTRELDHIYATVLQYYPRDGRETAVYSEVLHQLDLITQARRARLVAASGIVPGVIWLVLFSGAILTTGFTFFFGSQNLRAQVLMNGVLSIMIFGGLVIITAIDRPFVGSVKVGTEAISLVLEDFGQVRHGP